MLNLRINRSFRVLLVFLVVFAVGVVQGICSGFRGKLVTRKGTREKVESIFVRKDCYRINSEEDGQVVNIIVNKVSGKTNVLVPARGVYLEFENRSFSSLISNPIEGYRYGSEKYNTKKMGEETVNGVLCDKEVLSRQGREILIAWISKEYNFPIEIGYSDQPGRSVEVTNVKVMDLNDDFFKIPSKYKLVKEIPRKRPAWADDVTSAPLLKVPFERELAAGDMVKIKPVLGYKATFKVSTAGSEKATVSCVPFKGGEPLMDPSLSTFLLKAGERIKITRKERPTDADEIVIRCKNGRVKVVGIVEEAPFGVVLKKYYLKRNQRRSFRVNAKKKVRLIIGDDVEDKKDTIGEAVFYEEVEKKIRGGGCI